MAKAVQPRMKFIVEVAVTVEGKATKKVVREEIAYCLGNMPQIMTAKVRKVDLD